MAPSWIGTYLIFHIYFIQCLFYGFSFSMHLTYKSNLHYDIIGLFAAAYYPYSFKFFIAPFEQKLYKQSYGKRKTWIVFSLFCASIIICYMSTIVTNQNYIHQMILCLTLLQFSSAFNDVATDALAVQLIKDSSTLSKVNFMGEQFGKIVTSSIFLLICFKSTLTDYLGYTTQIISPSTFLFCLAIFVFSTAITIHFLFKQKSQHQKTSSQKKPIFNNSQASTQEQQEQQLQHVPIADILKHYLHFIHIKYQICRQSLAMLFLNFGLLFFISSYEIELINNDMIEREILKIAQDSMSFGLVFIIIVFSRYIKPSNMHKFKEILTTMLLVVCISVYLLDLTSKYQIVIAYCVIWGIYGFQYYVMNCIMAELSKCRFAGITITTFLSLNNYCGNTFIQKEIINVYGYDLAVKGGFAIAAVVVVLLPSVDKWIKRGQSIGIKQE